MSVNRVHRVLRNTSWYFGGTAVSALLGFINTPLLTRILEPKVYAQYGILITFTTALTTFIYLGQDEAFMRFFDKRKLSFRSYFWHCIRVPLFLCALVVAVLLEPSHLFLNWFFGPELSFTCILICFYITIIVFQRFLMLTARMEERAANYAISNVVSKACFMVGTVVLYCLIRSISFGQIIVCLLFGVVVALAVNLTVVINVSHGVNCAGNGVSSKELLQFGLPFAFSSTLFLSTPLIEKLIVRFQTSWDILAIYTSAAIFVTVMNLVKTTVNSIWVPYVYKNYQDEEHFKMIFYNVGIFLIAFCLSVVAVTILMRRWLVLVFDSRYYESMLIAPAMVCGACFDLLSGFYSIGINITMKTKYHIVVPIVQLIISSSLLFAFLSLIGLRATGISYLLSVSISRMFQMLIALRYYNTGKANTKMIVMFLVGVSVALSAVFFDSMMFDVISCGCLMLFVVLLSHKELSVIARFVFGNRKLSYSR